MAEKVKVAISWAAACGGCDVSILDTEEHLFKVTEMADLVYWPVALDFKRKDLLAQPDASIDVGIFNGAIRTSEHEQDALAFRSKCRLLVACGACASFGGVPGLGNLTSRRELLDVAYQSTPSTDNPDGVRPQIQHRLAGEPPQAEDKVEGHTLTLPEFLPTVRSLPQVVDVDVVVPGCPPPLPRILDLVGVLAAYAAEGSVPAPGSILAADAALCDLCPRRHTRQGGRIESVKRPHEVVADPNRCFLEQGILCAGIVTRGGCEATCINANAPCRGCFGPAPGVMDPGADAVSAIGSVAGRADENDVLAHEMKKTVRSIQDLAGTFYRFTLPQALVPGAVTDRRSEEP